jgi:hypothetical protein
MKVIENVTEKIAAVLQDWDVEFGDNIVNDICKAAGISDTLVIGELHEGRGKVYPGKTINGVCYKDERAFHEDEDVICYIPAGGIDNNNYYSHSYAYTRSMLFHLVASHVTRHSLSYSSNTIDDLTDKLFDELNWQFPETIIDQWSESLNNE